MAVDRILLLQLHVEVAAQVGVSVGKTLDVSLDSVQVLILILQSNVVRANDARQINVACLGSLDVLAEVIAVGAHAVDILAKGTNLNASRGVDVLQSGQLSFGFGESDLLVTDFKAASLNGFIGVGDEAYRPVEVEVEGLGAVTLVK